MNTSGAPVYGNQTGNTGHGALRGGAEGAAVGGLVGHEGHHGHTGRDAALAGTGGAVLGHEHNRHQHNANYNAGGAGTGYDNGTGVGAGAGYAANAGGMGGMSGAGAGYGNNAGGMGTSAGTGYGQYGSNTTGAGGMSGAGSGPGVSSNQAGANLPSAHDAKKLERSGKIDKVVGTLIGSTQMKERGYQKQADGAAIREQSRHLGIAQELEAEAQMRRGAAVGMGAHPSHGVAPNPMQAGGVQPSY